MIATDQRPIYLFLLVQTVASVIGLQTWQILFNNFAVEMAGINGKEAGYLQSVREIPGFLALLAVYVLLVLREQRLAALSVLFLGAGTALAGFFPSFTGLVATTLIMSFGFHYFETTSQSLILQHFQSPIAPHVFARLRSLSALASIGTGVFIILLQPLLSYSGLFLALGSVVALMGIWGLRQEPSTASLVPQKRSMVLRRRYSLFYLLTFLAGGRRQIFVAFSVFLMVKVFGFSVGEITALFVVNNALNYFFNPLLGRAIVRFGERSVLSIEYLGLIFVFLTYAYASSKLVIALMYVVDHLLYNFAIGIRTYFQKIAAPEDIAPSTAVGFTINHIAAVVIPVAGGLLWMVDYRIPFIAGAGLSLISLIAVQWIPAHLSSDPAEVVNRVPGRG